MIVHQKHKNIALDFISDDGMFLNIVRNNEAIRKWCRQVGLIDDLQQENWLRKISSDPTIRMYSIKDIGKTKSYIVGVCGLTDIDHINQRAEFSCYIFPEVQGNGYATKALEVLFRHGFNDLNLNIIWGETFEGNPAYKLFINKLGMKHEGSRCQFYFKNGKFIDAYLVSISRKEFNAIFTNNDELVDCGNNFDSNVVDFLEKDKKRRNCKCKKGDSTDHKK